MKFPKSLRLLERRDFQRVSAHKKRFRGNWISIDFRESVKPFSRLGITVSRKQGKSHDRIRFKRVVREAFRVIYSTLPLSVEMNISPRLKLPIPITTNDLVPEILTLIKNYVESTPKERG